MQLDDAISLWRGRAADATLLGASSSLAKDNTRLMLVTSGADVREVCAQTRKCVNHWTFRAGSAHALHVPAVRHPHSRTFFGICGAPGVSASKKARQARRQESNKTAALPANEGLAVWRDTDLDVAKWRRAPLQSSAKAFALLAHPRLREEVLVVFQDGSFATYDEDATRSLHSDDAKDVAVVEEEEEEEEEEQEETVVWSCLESDHVSPMKGGLFLSLLMQKGEKQHELLVYQVDVPNKSRRQGGVLGAALLVRRRVKLPDNEELSSCAFHPITFSYSFVGRSGTWHMLRFARDALSNSLTLLASQQLPNLTSADADSIIPVHKKRKLQASTSGYLVSGVGGYAYLVSVPKDAPTKYTGWDSKFAVPVASVQINLAAEKDADGEVVVGRSTQDGVGKIVQLMSVGPGEGVLAVFERGIFLIPVLNKNSTLASVLGATASSALDPSGVAAAPALPDSSVEWGNVTATSSVNNDTLDAETWKTNMCSDDDRERQLIADLLDPKVTPTAAEFSSRLNEALKKQKKRKAGDKNGEEVSFRLLQTVTRRCLDSTDLKLWGPLETMLCTNRLSARAEPTLLSTLMQHNQFALLECAIVHLIDIDERAIVRLMKYFIRKSSNSAFIAFATKRIKATNKETEQIDGSAACERFAVALLGLPTNNVFLHRAIRELELEEVLLVLAICKKLLLVHTTGSDEDETTKKDNSLAVMKEERRFTPLPSASRCCAWICALLDAHLSALVQRASQNAEVSRTLHQLEDLVQLQLRASAQYELVHGVLTNFLSGVQLPKAPGIPDYSIEELRL
ncbi:hypothetical protein PF005_g16303 [Phytophthora fragariae]|uniref:Nucleolar protein 11 C-terminal domain-containing protein n=1 Tax=Phytophthora fragariae TaxID=53985 RepID=A0A6A4D425_9STRA|nr:hypothetical protein PF003_g3416 [Phytophthora fragariae]KAE8932253.1 hypothetical protein PF009_g17710 [Phytophthora fragariae]KAE9093845.1 hypothetical protein PF007_g17975 [Phytophthora fragariae]KAE9097717.1 hypothetical protein PF010_g15840 [Phytophthora fragariae]KAE9126354.1 hypothetical protein PF006_g16751 [Phytophthora fragariae]